MEALNGKSSADGVASKTAETKKQPAGRKRKNLEETEGNKDIANKKGKQPNAAEPGQETTLETKEVNKKAIYRTI